MVRDDKADNDVGLKHAGDLVRREKLLTAEYPPEQSFIFRTSARGAPQTQFLVDEIAKRGLSCPALRVDKSGSGDAGLVDLEKALENLPRRYPGVVTTCARPFSGSDHDAISANMLWLGTWQGGERTYVYKDDAARASVIRRKE